MATKTIRRSITAGGLAVIMALATGPTAVADAYTTQIRGTGSSGFGFAHGNVFDAVVIGSAPVRSDD